MSTLMVQKRAGTCAPGRLTRGLRTGSTGTGSTGSAALSAIRGLRDHKAGTRVRSCGLKQLERALGVTGVVAAGGGDLGLAV